MISGNDHWSPSHREYHIGGLPTQLSVPRSRPLARHYCSQFPKLGLVALDSRGGSVRSPSAAKSSHYLLRNPREPCIPERRPLGLCTRCRLFLCCRPPVFGSRPRPVPASRLSPQPCCQTWKP